jgi:hypothetical protein
LLRLYYKNIINQKVVMIKYSSLFQFHKKDLIVVTYKSLDSHDKNAMLTNTSSKVTA